MSWRCGPGQELLRVRLLGKLLCPVQSSRRKGSPAHSSEYHGYHLRWDAALQRGSQNFELGFSLLKTETFLVRALFFLSPFLLFRFRMQPRSHGVF